MPAFFFFPSPPSFCRLDAVTNADTYGSTALHWAAGRGHLPIVDLLLRSGAAVNAKSKLPLHCGLKCVVFMGKVVRAWAGPPWSKLSGWPYNGVRGSPPTGQAACGHCLPP
jgi:ankyrin repeat protein